MPFVAGFAALMVYLRWFISVSRFNYVSHVCAMCVSECVVFGFLFNNGNRREKRGQQQLLQIGYDRQAAMSRRRTI